MAKNNGGYRMKGNQMYRRPTKAMQQQYMRNNQEMQLPEMPTKRKLITQHIIVGVIIVGASVALSILVHWALSFLGLVAAMVYLLMVGRKLNAKQKELFSKYQEMGMTKKTLIRQLQVRKVDQKQIDSTLRMWDAVAQGDKFKRTWMDKIMGL